MNVIIFPGFELHDYSIFSSPNACPWIKFIPFLLLILMHAVPALKETTSMSGGRPSWALQAPCTREECSSWTSPSHQTTPSNHPRWVVPCSYAAQPPCSFTQHFEQRQCCPRGCQLFSHPTTMTCLRLVLLQHIDKIIGLKKNKVRTNNVLVHLWFFILACLKHTNESPRVLFWTMMINFFFSAQTDKWTNEFITCYCYITC